MEFFSLDIGSKRSKSQRKLLISIFKSWLFIHRANSFLRTITDGYSRFIETNSQYLSLTSIIFSRIYANASSITHNLRISRSVAKQNVMSVVMSARATPRTVADKKNH